MCWRCILAHTTRNYKIEKNTIETHRLVPILRRLRNGGDVIQRRNNPRRYVRFRQVLVCIMVQTLIDERHAVEECCGSQGELRRRVEGMCPALTGIKWCAREQCQLPYVVEKRLRNSQEFLQIVCVQEGPREEIEGCLDSFTQPFHFSFKLRVFPNPLVPFFEHTKQLV
jgi:hypothetical protein